MIGNLGYKNLGKSVIDFMLSFFSIVILAPFFLICPILIKLTSKGPVFFKWHIIGLNGKKIVGYKFRTMVNNAELIEHALRENGQNDMNGIYFKLESDMRVTRVGKILRKYSIDEFPTIFCVLKGDLSIVGPRPVRTHEFLQLNEHQMKRFVVRPGLTSSWVVNGKNKITDFNDIVKLDLEYIENVTFMNDIKIIAKTILFLVKGENY